MVLKLNQDNLAATRISIEPAWFMSFEPPSNITNYCNGVGGYLADANHLLLLITHNGRPNYPHFSLVLLDANSAKVLDIINDFGEIPYKTQVEGVTTGLKVKLTARWTSDSGGEYPVPAWQEVIIKDQRLIARWSK